MELIPVANCSLLYLRFNDMDSFKKYILEGKKEVKPTNIIVIKPTNKLGV